MSTGRGGRVGGDGVTDQLTRHRAVSCGMPGGTLGMRRRFVLPSAPVRESIHSAPIGVDCGSIEWYEVRGGA